MIIQEQIDNFNSLKAKEAELTADVHRLTDFIARSTDNADTLGAMKDDMIFVKFAGTGCYLKKSLFDAAIVERKKEIEKELKAIEIELTAI